jgi:hypothetical protein
MAIDIETAIAVRPRRALGNLLDLDESRLLPATDIESEGR